MSNLSGFVKRLRDIMRNDAGINGDAQRIEQIAWMLFLKVYDAKEQDWEFDETNYESIIPEPCRWSNWAHDDKSGSAMTGDTLLNFVNNTLFPVLKGSDIKDSSGNVLIEGVKVTADTPIKKAIVQTTFADANQYMKDGVLLRQVINVIDELELDDYEESHAFGEIYESILKELQSAGSAGEFYTPRAVTDFMAQMIQPKIGEKMADFACGTGGFITSWLKVLQKQVNSTADAKKYGESVYCIEKKQFPYMLCVTNLLLHGLDIPQVFHDNTLLRDVLDYTVDDQFEVILMNPPYGGSEKADVKNHFPDDLASSETADLFMAVIMYRLKQDGRAAVILPDGFLFGTDNAKVNLKKKLLSEFNLHTVIRMPGSVFAPYTSITTNILFFDRTKPTEETWFYRMDMPECYKHFSKTKPMKLEHFAPVVEWWKNRQEIAVDGFDKSKKFTVQQLAEELGYNLDQCGYPHIEEEILAPMDLIQRYQEERASLNATVDRAVNHIAFSLSANESTNSLEFAHGALTRLVEIDSTFSDRMQKSILQMAIQGKLVEQCPEEGTGEDIFWQIQTERQVMIKAGKIKKGKAYPAIDEDEIPFDIPETWTWARLQDLVYNRGQKIPNETFCYIDIGSIDNKRQKLNPEDNVIEANKAPSRARKIIQMGDILYSTVRPYLHNMCIIDREFSLEPIASTGFAAMTCFEGIDNKYLFYYLLSPAFDSYANDTENAKGVAYPAINDDRLYRAVVPVPPLAEQKRIVAKLEEILPLCERLK